jgi:hypothetical protein
MSVIETVAEANLRRHLALEIQTAEEASIATGSVKHWLAQIANGKDPNDTLRGMVTRAQARLGNWDARQAKQ